MCTSFIFRSFSTLLKPLEQNVAVVGFWYHVVEAIYLYKKYAAFHTNSFYISLLKERFENWGKVWSEKTSKKRLACLNLENEIIILSGAFRIAHPLDIQLSRQTNFPPDPYAKR